MGDTSIEWTDKTWNPVTGCTKVSQGCKHCYAERVFPRAYGNARKFTDVLTHHDRLEQPLRWRKPSRVFVNSMSDLFHEDVPFEFIYSVFVTMAACEWHTFQILTKRPQRMQEWFDWTARENRNGQKVRQLQINGELWPIPNVWLGVSCEDQKTADDRIPLLKQTPAACRFISYEPALGPLYGLDQWLCSGSDNRPFWTERCPTDDKGYAKIPKLDWMIVGGESGPGARPFNIQWARDVIRQCRDADVACFVKQLGARPIGPCLRCGGRGAVDCWQDGMPGQDECPKYCYGSKDIPIELSNRKGVDWSEWPEDLRVRQWPKVSQELERVAQ